LHTLECSSANQNQAFNSNNCHNTEACNTGNIQLSSFWQTFAGLVDNWSRWEMGSCRRNGSG